MLLLTPDNIGFKLWLCHLKDVWLLANCLTMLRNFYTDEKNVYFYTDRKKVHINVNFRRQHICITINSTLLKSLLNGWEPNSNFRIHISWKGHLWWRIQSECSGQWVRLGPYSVCRADGYHVYFFFNINQIHFYLFGCTAS